MMIKPKIGTAMERNAGRCLNRFEEKGKVMVDWLKYEKVVFLTERAGITHIIDCRDFYKMESSVWIFIWRCLF